MDPVSSANQFAIQLRQRLTERARIAAKTKTDRTGRVEAALPEKGAGLSAFVASHGAEDHETRRALVEQLLADQFGSVMLNQAKFQQIVDQVTSVMESDPDLVAQMTQVLKALPSN